MTEPKYALCPHCGYQNMKPDGSCGLCIPPEFRAETAREFFVAILRNKDLPDDPASMAVCFADALIAALRKPPSK